MNDHKTSRCSKSMKLAPLDRFTEKHLIKRPSDYTIDKLHELITDPLTSSSKPWINRLLGDFLRDVGNDGFVCFNPKTQKLQHLPAVMQILEFLAWRARDCYEYHIHLDKMLELCKLPPLLQKSSDSLRCANVLEQYFSLLGYLMVVLPNDEDILKVVEAICNLLIRSKPAYISAVKLQLCHDSMEISRLPTIITKLTEICSQQIYLQILELAFLITTVSHTCCHRMLENGILDFLLMRLSEKEQPEEFEDSSANFNTKFCRERMALTTNIMWSLIQSIFPPKKRPPCLEKLLGPSLDAMRSLQNVFRSQVLLSHTSIESMILRNDLAVLILAGLVAIPAWHLVKHGLAEDFIMLSIVKESGIKDTWTEHIMLDTSNENVFFKKIMLTTLCYLSNRNAAIAIMVKRKVMPAILELVKPSSGDPRNFWSPAQFWYLSQIAMRTLARLAPRMPKEFTHYKGTTSLLNLVRWSLTVDFNTDMVMEYTRVICSIVCGKCPLVLSDFHEKGLLSTIIELVNRILIIGCLTMRHQRILTLLVITIEEISKIEENPCKCDDERLTIIARLLQRCFCQRKEDFPLDHRLLIAIGSYIWQCIVPCHEMIQKFVDNGGTYTIFDVIENACFPVRCIYLGILTDMCSKQYGVLHFLTWRGADKTKGFMSLLARSWREEEIRTGVKRTAEGCIEDVELPMMGTEQWIHAFHAKATHDFSPALASMFGSLRPKIHAIRKLLASDADRYQKSKEHYKILANELPIEDRITMYIADHFYRFAQGQVWSEISRYLEQVGVNLLGMDGEIIFLMNQRHRDWGLYVRGLQDKLIRAEHKKEAELEKKEFIRIRDSKLGMALKALGEIDYIRRTTEHDYMVARKNSQRNQVNRALRFPDRADDEHCHRTFNNGWNVTTILNQNHTVPSILANSFSITEIPPVSPESCHWELTQSASHSVRQVEDSESRFVDLNLRGSTHLPRIFEEINE